MTEQILMAGPAGQMELLVDYPTQAATAFAIVCHPHPLIGGTPQHKVPTLLMQLLVEQGCIVYRPYFRGLGHSQGVHDEGFGETEDILYLIQQLRLKHPTLQFYAAGFSFGAHVIAKCYAALSLEQRPKQLILCGLPAGEVAGLRRYDTPIIDGDLLLIHGEKDQITPLQDVFDWAQTKRHPVMVLPGANHYFTGYLKALGLTIRRYLKINH
ncbi:alpha/beta hydrolase [Acinetobacter larvae]|uniref:Hydrolase n=1 Tax=Acinetobacter larvae TaxID=1789224 RepID=A0A1B2M0N2_9GAMM|nr:hydrolase [Acinetobacter larvae]AOA58729.1 hydrolase [Acinetobacter larvae]